MIRRVSEMMYVDVDGNELTQEQWVALFEVKHTTGYGRIGVTEYDGVAVSTVWLGLNHNWDRSGPPHIFETMVFGAPDGSEWDGYQVRYSTKEQAAAGHAELCSMVFRGVLVDVPDMFPPR